MMLPDLDLYLAWLKTSDHSPNTHRDYQTKLRQFGRWLEDRPFDQGALLDYRNHCQLELGHAPATIHLSFCALTAYVTWLRERRRGRWPNPRKIKLPRRSPHSSRRCPSDAQVLALFRAAVGLPRHTEHAQRHRSRAQTILAIFAYTGLRRSECLSLEARDIKQAPDAWHVHVRCGKGRQIRYIPLCPEGVTLVREWLELRERWVKERGIVSDNLFPVDRHRPRLSHEGLESAWRELLCLAGLEHSGLTPHCLRHWYGTQIDKLYGITVACEMLGHSSTKTTERYLHVSWERKVQAANALGGILAAVPEGATPGMLILPGSAPPTTPAPAPLPTEIPAPMPTGPQYGTWWTTTSATIPRVDTGRAAAGGPAG